MVLNPLSEFLKVMFYISNIMCDILIGCNDSYKALKWICCIYVIFKYYVLSYCFFSYTYNYNRSQWKIMIFYMVATLTFYFPGIELLLKSRYIQFTFSPQICSIYTLTVKQSMSTFWIYREMSIFNGTFIVHLSIAYQREISTFL